MEIIVSEDIVVGSFVAGVVGRLPNWFWNSPNAFLDSLSRKFPRVPDVSPLEIRNAHFFLI